MSDELLEKLIEKTDTLIRLQGANATKDLESQKEKVEFLSLCGIGQKDIAAILGTTTNSVSTTLARLKKAKK